MNRTQKFLKSITEVEAKDYLEQLLSGEIVVNDLWEIIKQE